MSFETAKKRMDKGPTGHPDIMSHVLRHTDGKRLTPDEIGKNANILIVARSETTATLLSGVTFWLLQNPDFYRKLTDEIRGSFVKEEDITLQRLSRLPYLLASLREGLRIYPPVPSGLARVVPRGRAMLGGHWIVGKVGPLLRFDPKLRMLISSHSRMDRATVWASSMLLKTKNFHQDC